MAKPPKNGDRMVVFVTEVDFRCVYDKLGQGISFRNADEILFVASTFIYVRSHSTTIPPNVSHKTATHLLSKSSLTAPYRLTSQKFFVMT